MTLKRLASPFAIFCFPLEKKTILKDHHPFFCRVNQGCFSSLVAPNPSKIAIVPTFSYSFFSLWGRKAFPILAYLGDGGGANYRTYTQTTWYSSHFPWLFSVQVLFFKLCWKSSNISLTQPLIKHDENSCSKETLTPLCPSSKDLPKIGPY
jgi:hypothetical protein